jgi:hypothetical protein
MLPSMDGTKPYTKIDRLKTQNMPNHKALGMGEKLSQSKCPSFF